MEINLIKCNDDSCNAEFLYVPARRSPNLCIDHADDVSRQVDGWTPENSVD